MVAAPRRVRETTVDIFISTENQPWVRSEPSTRQPTAHVTQGRDLLSDFKGFGICFNELGWKALKTLGENSRNEVLQTLFSDQGLNLNYCRIPLGANDYSTDWYSHNETDGDI